MGGGVAGPTSWLQGARARHGRGPPHRPPRPRGWRVPRPHPPLRRGRCPSCGILSGFGHARAPADELPLGSAAPLDRRAHAVAGVRRPGQRAGAHRPLRLVVTARGALLPSTPTAAPGRLPAGCSPLGRHRHGPDSERCPTDRTGRTAAGPTPPGDRSAPGTGPASARGSGRHPAGRRLDEPGHAGLLMPRDPGPRQRGESARIGASVQGGTSLANTAGDAQDGLWCFRAHRPAASRLRIIPFRAQRPGVSRVDALSFVRSTRHPGIRPKCAARPGRS